MSRHQISPPAPLAASAGQARERDGVRERLCGRGRAARSRGERTSGSGMEGWMDGGKEGGREGALPSRGALFLAACLAFSSLCTLVPSLLPLLSEVCKPNVTNQYEPRLWGCVCACVCACMSAFVDPDLLDFKNLPLPTPSQPVSSELQPSTSMQTFIYRRIPFSRRKRNCHHVIG